MNSTQWKMTLDSSKITLYLPAGSEKKTTPKLPAEVTVQYGEFDYTIPRHNNHISSNAVAFDQYHNTFRAQFVDQVLKLTHDWRIVYISEAHNHRNSPEIGSLIFGIAKDRTIPNIRVFSEADIRCDRVTYLDQNKNLGDLDSGFMHIFSSFPPDRQTLGFGKQILTRVKKDFPDSSFPASTLALKTPTKENILGALDELIDFRTQVWAKDITGYLAENPQQSIIIHCGFAHVPKLQRVLSQYERHPVAEHQEL